MPQIIRELFEQELADFLKVPKVLVVNSGTSALVATLWSLNLKPQDEVITTPFTFISTATAIKIAGATPVFVDINEEDHLIDPRKIEAAITSKTKVIIPVHLFGRICRMGEIMDLAKYHDIRVIEDAAQSFGTKKVRYAGTWGDAGCFSFYKTKNLSTFEGGAISLPEDSNIDIDQLKAIIDPSINRIEGKYYGFNFKMPEPCALIGYEKLKFHKKAILSELGNYSEEDGFYNKLIYHYPAFSEYRSNCPIADAIVEKIGNKCRTF